MIKIDLVVPIFMEGEIIEDFAQNAVAELGNYDYQIYLCVDKGLDNTEEKISQLCKNNSRITALFFGPRAGHQTAIYAGLEMSRLDALTIMMDGDLQHPTSLIPEIIRSLENGYDICQTVRKSSIDERRYVRWASRLFYRVMSRLSGVDLKDGMTDFRGISPHVKSLIISGMNVEQPFLRAYTQWLSFPTQYIEYEAKPRQKGKSKFTLNRLLKFAVSGIVSFSTIPLSLITIMGFCISFITALLAMLLMILKLMGQVELNGWTSLAVLILMSLGLQLSILGIIGQYLVKIVSQLNRKPLYVTQRILNPIVKRKSI